MTHVIGEVHPNGKWVWTEYKKGEFDWRTRKTETHEVEEKEVIATSPKARTKKQFIAETNRNLTKEECEEYWKMGKQLDLCACSTWNYLMGRIGNCKLTIENRKTGKVKDFDKHPDWRPLGYYSFSTRGWSGEYLQIEGYIQDWSEIRKISDTESFTVTLMKHPHQ